MMARDREKYLTLARVGGLSSTIQKNDRSPERRGIYAFLWPHIELFLLSSTDPEGVTSKDLTKKVPWLLRQFTGLTHIVLKENLYSFGSPLQLKMGEAILQDEAIICEYSDPINLDRYPELKEYESLYQGAMLKVYKGWNVRPSRLQHLQQGVERLRKFQYTGFLWSHLNGGSRTIQKNGIWGLIHTDDIPALAASHLHNLKTETRKYNPEGPPGGKHHFSKDEWEVFVPANRGKIRG